MCVPYVSIFLCVQYEDAAVSSIRSRNAEPPGPESFRRREEALYADSRCVSVCVCVFPRSTTVYAVYACIRLYLQAHYEFQGCWQHTHQEGLLEGDFCIPFC